MHCPGMHLQRNSLVCIGFSVNVRVCKTTKLVCNYCTTQTAGNKKGKLELQMPVSVEGHKSFVSIHCFTTTTTTKVSDIECTAVDATLERKTVQVTKHRQGGKG